MITYFPKPYPDELAYSVFCRYYVHSGCFTHKQAMQKLYCKKSDNPSKEFIGNLNSDALSYIEKAYSIDAFILEHTMFPQYARFVPIKQKQDALVQLRKGNCDVHHLFPVLPPIEGGQFLRYCPLCVQNDRDMYGETYWHRKHQIRNIQICTKHRCRLISSSVSIKSEQSYMFYPAECHVTCAASKLEHDRLIAEYSLFLENVFDALVDFKRDVSVNAILYHAMRCTKYMNASGKTRQTTKLAKEIEAYYLEMGANNIASIHQIQRTLLGERFDFSVVCQIAFFLGISAAELTHPALTEEHITQEQQSHYVKNATPIDWALLDEKTAEQLENIAKAFYDGTINSDGKPERVSERLVYREMGLKKHQLEKLPKCRAVFERYTEPYPEYWARKIIWAYQRLLSEQKKEIFWSDIRSITGAKKKNINVIYPFLFKHINKETAEAIIKLIP